MPCQGKVLERKFLAICCAGPAITIWLSLYLGGCGAPAAPLPPSLKLPAPVQNLAAVRVGNSVRLDWTMPTRTTDKIVLREAIPVQICRAVGTGPCAVTGNLKLEPGKAGTYSDQLPADLVQPPVRLLRYEVELRNHSGKSAGSSNAAYSAAGAGPPALTGLSGQVRADGVLLSWQPVPQPGRPTLFRIQRLDTAPPETDQRPKSSLAPSTPAAAQTLAVRSQDGEDPGHAMDASAEFNRQYRYTLERIVTVDLSGHSIEIQGPASEAILVTTTDEFPPAVPQGLVAVADAEAGTIDLSWSPNTENDLAAYHVYRRDAQQGGQAQLIATLTAETSFRDAKVQPGHAYAYSISASDRSNNESRRSPAVEETLPAR